MIAMGKQDDKKNVDLKDFVSQCPTLPKQESKHPLLGWGLGRLVWATADGQAYCAVENNAVKNRRPMTLAEERLWEELRGNKLGVHFRRQHVIGMYIADFVSLKNLLVIEVDGEYHQTAEQQQIDQYRTDYLQQKGFRVIRFTNQQVLSDLESVMSRIIKSFIV